MHNGIIKGIFNVFAWHSKTFIIWKWNCTTETELGDLMIKMYMKNMSDSTNVSEWGFRWDSATRFKLQVGTCCH